jgi:hypothetical protein
LLQRKTVAAPNTMTPVETWSNARAAITDFHPNSRSRS